MSDTHLGIMMVFGHDKHLFSASLKNLFGKKMNFTLHCVVEFFEIIFKE